MKDFNRKDLSFSLCGLNCSLCPMRLGGYCPGCGGGPGNQSCAIAKCSLQHDGVEYCFLCPEFPCDKFDGAEDCDSFITHQRQLSDIERAKEIGIDAYHKEQTRKVEILQTLLDEYNDGRKKTFYCLAVNLLPHPVQRRGLGVVYPAPGHRAARLDVHIISGRLHPVSPG